MRIAVASDHAGFTLKSLIATHLVDCGNEVVDLGTHDESSVDYPDYGALAGHTVVDGGADLAVCCCGTGIGIAIAANKVRGVRAAVVHDVSSARLARAHNDANIVCFGARLIGSVAATDAVDMFLSTAFEGGRHARRIEKISKLEEEF